MQFQVSLILYVIVLAVNILSHRSVSIVILILGMSHQSALLVPAFAKEAQNNVQLKVMDVFATR